MKKKGNLKDPSPPPLKKINWPKISLESIKTIWRIDSIDHFLSENWAVHSYSGLSKQVFVILPSWLPDSRRGTRAGGAFSRASEVPAVAGTRMWPPPRHTWAGREFRNSRQSESTGYWFGSFNLCPGHHRRAVFDFYGSPLSRGERNNHSSLSIDYISKFRRTICSYFIVWRIERNLERGIIDWILLIEGNEEDRID